VTDAAKCDVDLNIMRAGLTTLNDHWLQWIVAGKSAVSSDRHDFLPQYVD
jgi:hypothetical protein